MDTKEERSKRILNQLKSKYPGAKSFDLDGRGEHFVCEIQPAEEHPEYDLAVEVITNSLPHKHMKMTQYYTILSGNLNLHIGKDVVVLRPGDKYVVKPGVIHRATSNDECWVEIYSEPGWTKEDHITHGLD